jgi:hypothetical protein
VSAGFDHDCFVWSPFVNSLLYKLKGHSASLTGVHAVEDSPELITADASGVIKVTCIVVAFTLKHHFITCTHRHVHFSVALCLATDTAFESRTARIVSAHDA